MHLLWIEISMRDLVVLREGGEDCGDGIQPFLVRSLTPAIFLGGGWTLGLGISASSASGSWSTGQSGETMETSIMLSNG